MVKDNEPTGLVLRTLRRSLGLTQGDVARMLRCSRQMVNMLEKGRIGLSQDLAERYGTLIRLVADYGREIELLMDAKKVKESQVHDLVEKHVAEIRSFIRGKADQR